MSFRYKAILQNLARLSRTSKPDSCYIDRLPVEILCKIFKYINSAKDFVNCYNTCKKWRIVTRIPSLQKEVQCKLIPFKITDEDSVIGDLADLESNRPI